MEMKHIFTIEFLPREDWNMDEEDAALLWKEKSLLFLSSSLGLLFNPANAPVVGDNGRTCAQNNISITSNPSKTNNNLNTKNNAPKTHKQFKVNARRHKKKIVEELTFEVEKKTGESNSTEGLKDGGILRKDEGDTGDGDMGKVAGGKDLNFGISWVSEIPQLKEEEEEPKPFSGFLDSSLLERRSVKEKEEKEE